jgi:hypothetical protein
LPEHDENMEAFQAVVLDHALPQVWLHICSGRTCPA